MEGLDATKEAEARGIVFPMPPDLTLEVPSFNGSEGLKYRFSDCNKADRSSLKALKEFFSRLAVQVEEEIKEESRMLLSSTPEYISMSTFVFEDYFLLLARQMVQMARDALRNLKYPVQSTDSINDILDWIGISGGNTGVGALTAQELMEANKEQKLKDGIALTLAPEHILFSEDTLSSIAQRASLDIMQLASYNSDNTDMLRSGVTITYTNREANINKSHVIQSADTLSSLTENLGLTLGQVVSIIESVYLFGWEEIPGGDNGRLIEILVEKFGIDWIRTAKIEKIDNGKTIKISTEENSLSLKLNTEETEVILEIDGIGTDRFIANLEDDRLKIYESFPLGTALNPLGKVYLPAINYRASYSDTLSSLTDPLSEKYYKDNSHSGDILQGLAARNAWVEGVLKPGTTIQLVLFNWEEIPGKDNAKTHRNSSTKIWY